MALLPTYDWLKLRDIITYFVSAIIVAHAAMKYLQARKSPLNAIPAVGYSGFLTSYITAFRWMRHGGELIQRGYDQHRGRPFKVATISRWVVILSGTELIEDLVNAPENVASLRQGVAEAMHVKYTLQRRPEDDCYHITTIRAPLTRHLVSKFDEIRDEIVESFGEYIPLAEDWVAVPAYEILMHIVCRANNRYFIGLPLCRDPGYRLLNERFTIDVAISARIINFFPDFLKPLAGKYLTRAPSSIKEAIRYLGPIIEERLAQEKQHGPKWPERPNDLISWLLETATQDYQHTIPDLAIRVLTVNFSAIHTTTMATTQALFDLAIHPEYVDAMREEAEAVVAEHGWTKAAMQKMHKIDSFLKESQRLNSLGSMLMTYKILRDWVTSDGTLIPAGTSVGVANDAINKDKATFPNAHTFKGFRFVNTDGEEGGSESSKYQMVSVTPDYLVFGYGRHACPGRFFAISEIKAIFAHILLNYDVQLENGSMERPSNFILETSTIPSMKTKVMFRKIRNSDF